MTLAGAVLFIVVMAAVIVFWIRRNSIPALIARAAARGHNARDYYCAYWASDHVESLLPEDRCKICNPEEF